MESEHLHDPHLTYLKLQFQVLATIHASLEHNIPYFFRFTLFFYIAFMVAMTQPDCIK